eukprot:gb/GECG01000372.1/.p1 GENE.gb/GECG01000372.1/~~gb/GECG01000372.1/.p1  ORF type:complete len:149 (+),score=18.15 gb/GECG01000372.1/:1-447(+)
MKDPNKHDISPLAFWRTYQESLPLLSPVVKVVFAIPAGPERLFSTAGWINHKLRRRLGPQKFRDIMMLRYDLVTSKRNHCLAPSQAECQHDEGGASALGIDDDGTLRDISVDLFGSDAELDDNVSVNTLDELDEYGLDNDDELDDLAP